MSYFTTATGTGGVDGSEGWVGSEGEGKFDWTGTAEAEAAFFYDAIHF